jgi:hypothetical protein
MKKAKEERKIKKYKWIGSTANYCNRLIVSLPPELYKEFPKGTPVEIVINKLCLTQ